MVACLVVQLRNLVTSPAKRGGFGFPGTTIGKMPEYIPDPPVEKPKRRRDDDDESKVPFKSASAPRGTLDTAEHTATGASTVYRRDDKCLPPRKDPNAGKTKKQLAEEREAAKGYEKPIIPSNPAKKGYNSYVTTSLVSFVLCLLPLS